MLWFEPSLQAEGSLKKGELLYIVNDIETSGSLAGFHTILSWGACVVTEEPLSEDELRTRGMIYYDELKPITTNFEIEAMRVGCLGLRCLREFADNPRYDPRSPSFRPEWVLGALMLKGTGPELATLRFKEWVEEMEKKNGRKAELVSDTTIFDPSHLSYYFTRFSRSAPYGYAGLDLDSYYRGFCKSRSASPKNLGVVDDRRVPHCAEDDAIFLAKIARELLYVRSTA